MKHTTFFIFCAVLFFIFATAEQSSAFSARQPTKPPAVVPKTIDKDGNTLTATPIYPEQNTYETPQTDPGVTSSGTSGGSTPSSSSNTEVTETQSPTVTTQYTDPEQEAAKFDLRKWLVPILAITIVLGLLFWYLTRNINFKRMFKNG